MESIRLQKFLAEAGIASRRKAEELISEGRVIVNGNKVQEQGTRVGANDIVEVDGKIIGNQEKKIYIIMNKPQGLITSAKDQFGRKTVIDLLEGVSERVYPVGRLDYDTSGLLLLSNDGDFTYKMTHPSHQVKKTYLAIVTGTPDAEDMGKFRNGLKIEDYITSPASIQIREVKENKSEIEVTIHEGKNRQVRKMFEAIDHPVISLKRIKEGKLELGNLKEGEWRYLTESEVNSVNK